MGSITYHRPHITPTSHPDMEEAVHQKETVFHRYGGVPNPALQQQESGA